MALINSLTTKPKLNISNIKSPFGSSATIPKISAGPLARALGQGISKPKTSPLNIDTFQIKTNIQNIDNNIALGRRIDMLSGAVFNINQQLSEVNAIIGDIGNALAMDFANRIANQQQDNKALKAQASAEKTSLAEGALEKTKKIGKGIGSGITGVASSVGKTLGLSNILSAAKVLAAGVAINALWPSLKKIFDWSMNNLDKILLVGGAILALNVLGGIGTLLKIGSLFLNPWFWAAMGVLALLAGGALHANQQQKLRKSFNETHDEEITTIDEFREENKGKPPSKKKLNLTPSQTYLEMSGQVYGGSALPFNNETPYLLEIILFL